MTHQKALLFVHKLFIVMAFFCGTTSAAAECMFFDPEQELPRIPLIVEATVIEANNDNQELSQCAGQAHCIFKAQMSIDRILKGTSERKRFTASYPYWQGCPGVNTFKTGEKRIFFLKADGTLYGKSCGFSGAPLQGDYAESIRKILYETKGSL